MERNTRKVKNKPDLVEMYIYAPQSSGYIAVHFNIGIRTNDSCTL